MSPQTSYAEGLSPSVMVFGDGDGIWGWGFGNYLVVFGRRLGFDEAMRMGPS